MNINQAINAYLFELELQEASVSHIRLTVWALSRFARHVGEDRLVSDLSQIDLVRFVRDVRQVNGDKYSLSSLNDLVAILKSFAKWLLAEGLHDENVAIRLKRKVVKTKRSRLADEDHLQRVIASFADYMAAHRRLNGLRDVLIVSFSNDSGARRGEIHRLTVTAVNRALQHPRRYRDGTVVYHIDSAGKSGEVILRFFERTAGLFRQWLEVRPAAKTDMLFVNSKGQPIHVRTITASIERICRFAGVPVFRTHAVRHRIITDVIKSGGSVNEAQNIANHASPRTTAENYLHLTNEDADIALARVHRMREKHVSESEEIAKLFGV